MKADSESKLHSANALDPLILCIRSGLLHCEVKNRILDADSGCRITKGDALEAVHQRCTVPGVLKPRLELEICRVPLEPRGGWLLQH